MAKKNSEAPGGIRRTYIAQRLHHGPHAVFISRHGEYAKRFPAELPLVLLGGVGGEVAAHFSLEAGLGIIRPDDGHRAAVDLDHETTAGPVGELQTERKIRDDANVVDRTLVRKANAQAKRIAIALGRLGNASISSSIVRSRMPLRLATACSIATRKSETPT